MPEEPPARALCASVGRGQFAAALAERHHETAVVCHFLDLYLADECRRSVPSKVDVVCAADPPAGEYDLVALPTNAHGEAELTRDLLQAFHQLLRDGGQLVAAVDNDDDQWLHDELRKLFPKVTRVPEKKQGVFYKAIKTGPLPKLKHFDCEFAFRDQGRLIRAFSRPGVFSHRRIDTGARTLINTMSVAAGQKVLDLGCGSGVVSLAAAFRAADVQVLAVDSNARAIQCTARGAELNGLTNIATRLAADGSTGADGTFDLVLANPPYFSHYRIADLFLDAARRALKPGGEVLVVTKTPAWFEERMPALFVDVRGEAVKEYFVVRGRR